MQKTIEPNSEVMSEYIAMAPAALVFERVMECRILAEKIFERPILDIGCGEGLFAKILFAEPLDTGIDPNPHELSRARELGAYTELIVCSGDKIPKPDGSFQTILSNSVIEHIPDIHPVLMEAYRLLAPGGRMYLTVPSNLFDKYTWISQALSLLRLNSSQERFSEFFNRFWVHYHFYTPKRWAEIVTNAGFEVVEVQSYGPLRVCLMNNFLVPFSIPALITKKLLNRWTLFPNLRRIIFAPLVFIARRILRNADKCEVGGLVFLSLRKAV